MDGGALLHRIPWTRGSSFSTILQTYVDYVNKRYPESVIVFDGYEGVSTKDMTHRRRSKGKKGMKISFNAEMSLSVTKDVFLNDATNKQRFIALLGEQLSKNNCIVYYAKADADFLIVQKAVEIAEHSNTVVVGDDTDVLVLLIYHAKLIRNEIFFIPEPKKN